MIIFQSPVTDPVTNLASEALLRAESAEDLLMVYINDPCVVIGRNQCAEAEADLAYCRDKGIKVIRRISGGGAVYHDRGNINYSFIRNGDSSLSDGKEDLKTVIKILGEMGIDAAAGTRSELLLDSRKISGTASFCRGGRYIFHGTLLFKSSLETLQKALQGDKSRRGRKIASVPSSVTNIRDNYPQWDCAEEFASAFTLAAAKVTGGLLARPEIPALKLSAYFPETII